jgi:hypothetical protein
MTKNLQDLIYQPWVKGMQPELDEEIGPVPYDCFSGEIYTKLSGAHVCSLPDNQIGELVADLIIAARNLYVVLLSHINEYDIIEDFTSPLFETEQFKTAFENFVSKNTGEY